MRRPTIRSTSSVASSAQWTSSSTTTDGRGRCQLLEQPVRQRRAAWRGLPRAPGSRHQPLTRAMSANGPNGRGVNSASQSPHSTRANGRTSSQKRRRTSVFPTPASPGTRTTPPRPSRASANASRRPSSTGSRSRRSERPAALPPLSPSPNDRLSPDNQSSGAAKLGGRHFQPEWWRRCRRAPLRAYRRRHDRKSNRVGEGRDGDVRHLPPQRLAHCRTSCRRQPPGRRPRESAWARTCAGSAAT